MGIRVHKMIGYGLTDLQTKDGRIIDPRINRKGILFTDDDVEDKDFSRGQYLDWLLILEGHCPEDDMFEVRMERETIRENENWEPHYSFINQREYGEPNVLCVIPGAFCKSWRRYDDLIDYYDETNNYLKTRQCNSVRSIPGGIYPYNGVYMDGRSGKPLRGLADDNSVVMEGMAESFVRLGEDCEMLADGRLVHHKKSKQEALDDITASRLALAKRMGFQDTVEAEKHIAPVIPKSVEYLCEFARVFVDPKTVFQLRPMIYVYWG